MSLARAALVAALDLPDVEPGGSSFSQSDADDALWVDARQIAHGIDETRLEIRLTRPVIRSEKTGVMADGRIAHPRESSDWVTLSLASDADVAFARDVIALAASAHRPPEGAVTHRPPTGADLAKRRRFH